MAAARIYRFRHRYAWDLRGIGNRAHRATVQAALNACDYPFGRVRRRTGKRVPVHVSDLSRFSAALAATAGSHVHVHSEAGEEGHLLGDATPKGSRAAALGLYWLPTPSHPAGRVELDVNVMADVPLAQEVFLAEAAHAMDYGAMTDAQRMQVMALFDFSGPGVPPAGWFEEHGEQDYWSWRGERWMGLFMAAYAPALPRPLEGRQPWRWTYDASDVGAVRALLR